MLRALAIFLVVAVHFTIGRMPSIHGRQFSLGPLGFWAVDCFFVLSGFLLSRPYISALLDPTTSWPSPGRFFARRFLRIYPLYAISVVVSCCIIWVAGLPPPTAEDFFSHLFLLHDFSYSNSKSLNGPLWTMPIDIAFYLSLPIIFAALRAIMRGYGRAARVRGLVLFLTVGVVSCLFYRYVQLRANVEAMQNSNALDFYVRNALGASGSFAVGIGLALYGMLNIGRRPHRWVYLSSLGLAVALVAFMWRICFAGSSSSGVRPLWEPTISDLVGAASVALLIFTFAEGHFASVTRVARSTFVAWAAGISYAVYLFHMPIIRAVGVVLGPATGNLGLLRLGVIGIPLILSAAALVHRFIEMPFLVLKEQQTDSGLSKEGVPRFRPQPVGKAN